MQKIDKNRAPKPPKIIVFRVSWGLLGALGGLLEPSWPTWAPRANITSKKVVRWPPFPPLLEPSWSPSWGYVGACW